VVKAPDSPDFAQRQSLAALRSVAKGDFSVRVSLALLGIDADIAEALNDVVSLNARMLEEFERISDVVGIDGRMKERAELTQVPGSWADYMGSLDSLIDDLTHPIAETIRVIGRALVRQPARIRGQ